MTQPVDNKPIHIPMALKLSLAVVSVLIAVTAVQGWMIAKQQSKLLAQEMRTFGQGTTQLLVRQVKEPLLSGDDLSLERIIQSTLQHESVAGVEIRNSEDQTISSSGTTPTVAQLHTDLPLFWTASDRRPYLSFLAPAYSNDLKIGEVVVTFHADVLDQLKNRARTYIIYSTLLLIVIGVVISGLISTLITLPIRRLINISERIADGDYQARFSKRRNDELGVLIESLDLMTEKLLHKIHVEQTFSKYVSPKVAKEVLNELAPQELGGKEINGSVLFADIIGFTSISESMSAPAVSELLNDYFTYIDQAAYQCDGYVDKYMGDCAMLLFGIPATHAEEHEVNAIYCALLIQRIIEQLNQDRVKEGATTVSFRIGVNCGLMLAGNMGSRSRMEYTVLGDTVNTASRLASVPAEGEVVITEAMATLPKIAHQFSCRRDKAIQLKGKKDPITVYKINTANEELEEKLQRDIGIIFSNIDASDY